MGQDMGENTGILTVKFLLEDNFIFPFLFLQYRHLNSGPQAC
jgi:hypothetical protein